MFDGGSGEIRSLELLLSSRFRDRNVVLSPHDNLFVSDNNAISLVDHVEGLRGLVHNPALHLIIILASTIQ